MPALVAGVVSPSTVSGYDDRQSKHTLRWTGMGVGRSGGFHISPDVGSRNRVVTTIG
jgi:hypothetical protein